jgi:serine/threonine protein kinase/sugar lactone lactonase YvrE
MADLPIGATFAGYRVERVLGRGGMGVVYLAEHRRLQVKHALKVIAPEHANDPEFVERFLREARLAAALDHPNIIPVHGADEVDGTLFISMRYVRGTDLAGVLRTEGRLEPERTLAILGQIGEALDAAHAEGLVHRDVKPANILIEATTKPGGAVRVFLTDFGLTKRVDSETHLTRTGYYMGSLHYSAPEQLQGKPLDGRTDEYALAAVLYQCLAGAPPFEREMDVQVISAHLVEEPPSLTAIHPQLPPEIDAVIGRGMAKAKENRYPTCGDLLADARRALTASPSPATSAPIGPEAARAPALAEPIPPPVETPNKVEPAGALDEPIPAATLGGLQPAATATAVTARTETPSDQPGPIPEPAGQEAPAVAATLFAPPPAPPQPRSTGRPNAEPEATPIPSPTPDGPPAQPIQRRRSRLLAGIAAAAVVVAGIVLAVVALGGGGSSASPHVGATIRVPTGPSAVTFGDGKIWVTSRGDSTKAGSLETIDPATDTATPVTAVGVGPSAIAFADHTAWVANAGNGTAPGSVTEIKDGSSAGHFSVGINPSGIAVGDGFVWVSDAGNGFSGRTVTRIPQNGGAPKDFPVDEGPAGIIVVGADVWVASHVGRSISVLDSSGSLIKRITTPGKPFGVTSAAGAIWVSEPEDGKVLRIDPGTKKITDTITVPGALAITFDGTSLWVTTAGPDGTGTSVDEVDPKSGSVIATVQVGRNPASDVFGDGSVWVAVNGANSTGRIVSRVQP